MRRSHGPRAHRCKSEAALTGCLNGGYRVCALSLRAVWVTMSWLGGVLLSLAAMSVGADAEGDSRRDPYLGDI
jgi:hypothetical protein